MNDQQELPPELEDLATNLSALSNLVRGLSIELPKLVNQTNDALAQGYYLSFNTDDFEIVGQCELKVPFAFQTLLSLETTFPTFHRHLCQTFELQASLQEAFAELTDAAVAKLPQKNGAPWRSYYMRECLDMLRKWPPEVEAAVPLLTAELNAADLVRVVNGTPRGPGPARGPGFQMQDKFMRYHHILEEAVSEIRSLRLEFPSSAAPLADEGAVFFVPTANETFPDALIQSVEASGPDVVAPVDDVTETQVAEPAKQTGRKQIQPTVATLAVIELVQKLKSTDEIVVITNKSVKNVRKIRSRYTRGEYALKT